MKQEIILHLSQLIEGRIKSINDALAHIIEDRNSETKSSAGDKYETGRAMAQLEVQKLQSQLAQNIRMQEVISSLSNKSASSTVELGSLVETSNGWYFIAVAIGAIELQGKKIFCISLASPIGELLYQKSPGESIDFRGSLIDIISVK